MKKIQLFLVMLLLSCLTAAAQSVTATGKVTYADDGSPVIGATIKVKGSSSGATVTDVNGVYKITIPAGAQKAIEATFLGLKTTTVDVPQSGTYNISMEADATAIEEVVVMGYGSARRMNTTVGSVAQVSAKKIEARPTASAMDAMQGQVAGLQVYTSSGEPGTMQSVRLHGIGSLTTSATPLYVLDGVQIDPSLVVSMNPNDFESISVLKDASATSIYGSRAANGVIYMTSKRGTLNSKARITVRGQYGISSLANKDFYNQMMDTETLWGFWKQNGIRSQAQIDELVDAGYTHNTKWIDYYQQNNTPTFQTELNIQGGGGKTTYFITGSQYSQKGTAPGSYFNRYTVRSNVESQATDWLKVGMNLHLSDDQKQGNSNYGTNSTSGGLSFLRQPYYSPYDKDGKELDIIPGLGVANPYYMASNNPDLYIKYTALANAFVEIQPIKDLKITSRAGVNYEYVDNSWKRMPSYIPYKGNGLVGERTDKNLFASITNTIEYKFQIAERHQLTALVGQEGTRNDYKSYDAQSSGHTDDRMMNLQDGKKDTYSLNSSRSAYNYLSFFGRLDYGFDDKVFLDLSVRNDASSRFGADNRSATFWSAGAMWNLKKESFLKDNRTITGLRAKASYGTQGNSAIGNYATYATVGAVTNYGTKPGWALADPGNPDLKWEVQDKLTAGVSIELWNKLSIDVEYYNRGTKDMLMWVPVPTTTGFEEILKNVGSMVNNGVDINISYNILSNKDYFLTFSTVFNYNSEKVTSLFDGKDKWVIANTGVAYVVGQPVMFYYPMYAGVNSQTGEMQWYKPGANVDKLNKDPNNVTSQFDEDGLTQNTGMRRYAPIAGGFSINGGWKGIALQADFAYSIGKNLISNDRFFSENPNQFAGMNTSTNVMDQWTKPGDEAYYPDWSNGSVMEFDSHLLEDASFLRLKNLSLSYTFPAKFWKGKGINGLKVFATGRNLLTFTKFKGIDPEADSNLTIGMVGNSKQYSFGLELIF